MEITYIYICSYTCNSIPCQNMSHSNDYTSPAPVGEPPRKPSVGIERSTVILKDYQNKKYVWNAILSTTTNIATPVTPSASQDPKARGIPAQEPVKRANKPASQGADGNAHHKQPKASPRVPRVRPYRRKAVDSVPQVIVAIEPAPQLPARLM